MPTPMKIFDSCARRVTLVEVAEDIASDLAFERYLENLSLHPDVTEPIWDEITHFMTKEPITT